MARKLYLTITLEKEMQLEALVDTGSDLTLISSQLFEKLKFEAQRQNQTLKFHTCELNVQSYSQNDIQLRNVAPIHLAIGPMSIVHPVYISPMNTYQFIIGKDLLDRFEPLLDFKHLQVWAQVRDPLPLQPHKSIEPDCQVTGFTGIPSTRHEDKVPTADQGSSSLLCNFRTTQDSDNYCPQVNSTRFPLNSDPSSMTSAKGICALNLKWNHRYLTQYFLILENPAHDVYIGADILIRLKAHVDMFNEVVWAPLTSQPPVPISHDNLMSGQTIPEVCTLINEQGTVVPAYTKGVAVRLNLRQGQTLNHTLAFFQPSPESVELGLTLEATPLTEVSSRVIYILFNNCTATDISIPKAYRLGWLVSHDFHDFHDFDLILPIIGPIPPALIPEGHTDNTLFTAPFQFIAITSVMSVAKQHVCRTELIEDQHLAVYTVSHQPVSETDAPAMPVKTNPIDDKPTDEPYQGFESQVQDSLDCGLTDLHTVRIPTHPEAPPTFVKQYKIPIASHEPVLASATTTPTDPIQTHLAYSLGSAIPLYVDPAQREVGFLLNLPIIETSRIYRLKDIVNVGFWQSNTQFKVRTPEVVAYHDSDPQLYLAPNLHMCTLTKDIHYLCPSKPFIRDNTDGICGLQQLANDARCPADAKPRNQFTETQAEIVGNRWLVNTPARSATLTYDQHDTATRVNLLNQSMWIQVPRGAILHLDDLALYHLPSEEYQAELEDWIEKGGSQVIDIAPLDSALQALSRLPILNTSPVAQAWTAADTALCISIILGHALTLGMAYVLYRKINAIRTSTTKLTEAVSVGFRRNPRKDDAPPENADDLIELNPQS
ncbi:hypothetical protein PO909_002865 [Leuciscus waleckii]